MPSLSPIVPLTRLARGFAQDGELVVQDFEQDFSYQGQDFYLFEDFLTPSLRVRVRVSWL